MEECGRGAAVEQLTARGMDYQSPQWGGNRHLIRTECRKAGINPRDGGNSDRFLYCEQMIYINPRNGGQ